MIDMILDWALGVVQLTAAFYFIAMVVYWIDDMVRDGRKKDGHR